MGPLARRGGSNAPATFGSPVQQRRKMPTAVAKSSVAPEPSAGVELLQKDVPQEEHFSDPQNFINRELSWLEFNRRVLEEAQDPTQPLIERVKFLTIVSSNLDEFFEIRVAGIKQQIKSETSDIGPDGLSPTDTFDRIQKTVRQLVATQYALWKNELLPELAKNGIYVREMAELSPKRAAWAHRYFQQEVLPMLTPLAVDASHPFPHLLNRSHNLLVRAKLQRGGEPMHAKGGVASDSDATRQKRRRTMGVHLSRLTHQTAHRRIVSRFDSGRGARVSGHAQ